MRSITRTTLSVCLLVVLSGQLACSSKKPPEYGVEQQLNLPGTVRQTWAVAPVLNLSGQAQVDPILQADHVYTQLQQVAGLNVIPVNRVVEVYQSLRIRNVESEEQAALVCDLLGADALLVATVTAYDPFDPPKLGASLQLFRKGRGYERPANVDPRVLSRMATPMENETPKRPGFVQVVGMFDSANGTTRDEVLRYAAGRNDPTGPYKARAYLIDMDRYCGFVYHSLISELLNKPALQGAP